MIALQKLNTRGAGSHRPEASHPYGYPAPHLNMNENQPLVQAGPQNYKAAMRTIAYIRRNCEHDWHIAGRGEFDEDKKQWKRYWHCNKCLAGMYSFEMPKKKGEIGDNTPIVD